MMQSEIVADTAAVAPCDVRGEAPVLRRNDLLYRALIESLPQQVFFKNRDSVFISVNAAFARDFKRRPEEFMGKSDYDLFPKELAEKYYADDQRIMGLGRPEVFEEKNVIGGRVRYVEVTKTPVIDEDGEVMGLLGIFSDITERRTAAEKLRQFAARLEENNRELQDFAYVASHDLQEPLRKVRAFGDRLLSKCGANFTEEGRDYLNRMLNAAQRMQGLIEDLLAFSRVTTRAQPFTKVDLNRIAREVVSDLEVRIEQTGGRVEIGELPKIDADGTQMRQLLQNLIGNALKFHQKDVTPVVKVNAKIDGARCRLCVEDNGIGFDEKYLDRIFTVFQRLHGRGEYEGSGVGLAICRKIAVRHGGEITAHSRPGHGATFIVTLPMQHEEADVSVPTPNPL